jgi:hypothetical protein
MTDAHARRVPQQFIVAACLALVAPTTSFGEDITATAVTAAAKPHSVPSRVRSIPTYEARRTFVIDRAIATPSPSKRVSAQAANVELLFAVGRDAEAVKAALVLSEDLKAFRHTDRIALFDWYPALDMAARHRTKLPTEFFETIKPPITQAEWYSKMRTSNLTILAWFVRNVGSELLGENAFSPQSAWRVSDPTAAKTLASRVEAVATKHYGEIGSRPYYAMNFLPILSLARCRPDTELGRKALMAFEAAMIRDAASWENGRWVIAATRSYPDVLVHGTTGSERVLWLYFGGPFVPDDRYSYLLQAALLDYEPSPYIDHILNDRERPYTNRTGYDRGRQTAYLAKTYGVFSALRSGGGYGHGVMFDELTGTHHNNLWITKPLLDNADPTKGPVLSASHTHGINIHELNEVQEKDAILYSFAIPPASAPETFPYALGFIPGGYQACQADDTHLFLAYPSVLVAISSSLAFTWDPKERMAEDTGRDPRYAGDSCFRVRGEKFAMALECARPEDFPGETPQEVLAAFRELIGKKTTIDFVPDVGYSYRSRHGDILEQPAFSGDAMKAPMPRINGTVVDFDAWPLIDNPWVHQDVGGPMTVTDGTSVRTYDFDSWTVTDTAK